MSIIKNTREKFGYTQVQLAKEAGLSLRTIQRLEASNKVPKGHSLLVLSEVFKMEPSVLQDQFTSNEQSKKADIDSIRLINLSVLAFFGIPFGNIILPVILWKRNRSSKLVDELGRRIINVQILWSTILCLLLCISPFTNFFLLKIPFVLVVLFFAMAINILIVCISSIKIQSDNNNFLNLPIRFI